VILYLNEHLKLMHTLHIPREGSKMTAICRFHTVIIQTFILHGTSKVGSTNFENVPCEGETYNLVQCFDARTIRTMEGGKYRVINEGKGGNTG